MLNTLQQRARAPAPQNLTFNGFILMSLQVFFLCQLLIEIVRFKTT